MKKLFITISTLVSLNLFSQNGIWVTSEDINLVQKTEEFEKAIQSLKTDVVIQKAFPSSRRSDLKMVYEITCSRCTDYDLYSQMNKVPGLRGIEYAPSYETLSTPNDYSLNFSGNWALDLIGAQASWDITTGDGNVVLAINDQNFYVNHEELTGKINYYDSTNTATKTHGTAVATIAAGNTNNYSGLSSIGYNSSLSLYRMNYNNILMASYEGAKVINLSWASGCSYNSYAQAAIDEAWNNGTFIIASAGNGTTCGNPDALVYPASYNHVFSVTSVGSQDNIEKIIGNPSTRHQTNSSVDICAPGHNVPITAAPGWYLYSSGTSFAAPYVTGTVGLMLSANPNLTTQEIDSVLRISATNINSLNPNYVGKIGSGRLNSYEAVRIAHEMNLISQEDGNNGHGNDEGEFDGSNPGQGNPGGNGNHYGWDKNNKELSEENSEKIILDMNGKQVNIDYCPTGFYFVIENGKSNKIYKY
jgi:subtilisin family serine protease